VLRRFGLVALDVCLIALLHSLQRLITVDRLNQFVGRTAVFLRRLVYLVDIPTPCEILPRVSGHIRTNEARPFQLSRAARHVFRGVCDS
jgi:hypothetical protein